MALNVMLGAAKLAVVLIAGSVSIVSDAANNLSDAGSSAMTVVSFALGGRGADKEHPYGHGRYEYIATLLIGVIIIVVGFQLILSSIGKIITPMRVEYDAIALAVLGASIAVKLFMGVFYLVRGKKLGSDMLRAASFDSFSDVAVTSGLLVAVVINLFVAYPLEGIVGLLISLFIVFGGVKLLLSTVGRLLGRGGDPDTEKRLRAIILGGDLVVGVHDLRVHDYGPNRKLASAHAEFEGDVSVREAHAVLDALEHKAYEETGVELVLHCDPIETGDVTLNRIRHAIEDVLRVYPNAGMHDLDIHYAERRVDLHICLPAPFKAQAAHVREQVEIAVQNILEGFTLQAVIDLQYEEI